MAFRPRCWSLLGAWELDTRIEENTHVRFRQGRGQHAQGQIESLAKHVLFAILMCVCINVLTIVSPHTVVIYTWHLHSAVRRLCIYARSKNSVTSQPPTMVKPQTPKMAPRHRRIVQYVHGTKIQPIVHRCRTPAGTTRGSSMFGWVFRPFSREFRPPPNRRSPSKVPLCIGSRRSSHCPLAVD